MNEFKGWKVKWVLYGAQSVADLFSFGKHKSRFGMLMPYRCEDCDMGFDEMPGYSIYRPRSWWHDDESEARCENCGGINTVAENFEYRDFTVRKRYKVEIAR